MDLDDWRDLGRDIWDLRYLILIWGALWFIAGVLSHAIPDALG